MFYKNSYEEDFVEEDEPKQVLPINVDQLVFLEDEEEEELDECTFSALAYLKSVQEEASSYPEIIVHEAKFEQADEETGKNPHVSNEKLSSQNFSYIEEINYRQEHANHLNINDPTQTNEANWKEWSIKQFINLRKNLNSSLPTPVGHSLEDVRLQEEFQRHTLSSALPNENEEPNVNNISNFSTSLCIFRNTPNSTNFQHKSSSQQNYTHTHFPSKSYLDTLQHIQITSLLHTFANDLIQHKHTINILSMSWTFALLTYLDELMALDEDVSYTLQRLRRHLEKYIHNNFTNNTPVEHACKLNITIISQFFNQK